MILLDKASYQSQFRYATYVGLSTDVKPIDNIENGDEFQEIDTGKVFRFDLESDTWYEQSSSVVKLESIEVVQAPNKTVYIVGQIFNPTGMTILARYTDGTSQFVNDYTFNPTGELSLSDNLITLSYTVDNVTKTTQQPIEVYEVAPVLNDNPWEVISMVSQNGNASSYWSVGDAKQITIDGTISTVTYDNYQPWVYILGFNHNAALEGNNLIHFGCFRSEQNYSATNGIALDDQYYGTQTSQDLAFHMNTTNTNAGGWEASYMRNYILDASAFPVAQSKEFSFLSSLSHDLQSVIRKCTKYTNNVGNSDSESSVTGTQDTVFLLSEYEVLGNTNNSNPYEKNYQKRYDYFLSGNTAAKYRKSNNSSANWALRSPNNVFELFFVGMVGGNGSALSTASVSLGLAPCFCV